MRVLMLGWEFPPFISGGLGTACYGLTKAMSGLGHDIVFVLPRPVSTPFSSHITLASPKPGGGPGSNQMRLDEFERVTFRTVESAGPSGPAGVYDRPTGSPSVKAEVIADRSRQARPTEVPAAPAAPAGVSAPAGSQDPPPTPHAHYEGDLFAEVQRYALLAVDVAKAERFDVIHAHDWMTFPAALAVAGATNKPLVVHVHSTEFDRAGHNVDQRIYDIERRGMHGAVRVIAVSHLTRSLCVQHYGVDPAKIDVVHNAIDLGGNGQAASAQPETFKIASNEKVVLFLGRITFQKGPEYFLAAAKRVLEKMDNVKFVMAGSGDMVRHTMDLAVQMGIGSKVLFTGFLRGPDVERIFKMADLYVMPSVSEPFGIAPLEAMSNDVPVIISKQSGVSEVLKHALKVDFWDVGEMANKIVAVLRHPTLAASLRQHGAFEVRRLSWTDAARACVESYERAIESLPTMGRRTSPTDSTSSPTQTP